MSLFAVTEEEEDIEDEEEEEGDYLERSPDQGMCSTLFFILKTLELLEQSLQPNCCIPTVLLG